MPSVTSPSAAMVTSPVDEDPWASAPVSRANSVHLRRRNRTRTNPEDMAPSSSAHPLAGAASSSATADGAAEASRPTLRRLTTENERQVAEASRSGSEGGSMRGSLDLLRMTADPDVDGVEVLIHEVSSGESLAGVSLQYGIDLATLRKANKLWASDTIHSRKKLYIPLEACRWNKATETFSRGPEASQITLTAKSAKKQGKEVDRSFSNLHLLDADRGTLPRSTSGSVYGGSEWGEEGEAAKAFMPDTNLAYEGHNLAEALGGTSRPPTASEAASTTSSSIRDANQTRIISDNPAARILTIIKLPSSQLQFFPKSQGQSQDDSAQKDRRPSLPSKLPKSGSIRNNLHSLPPPLKSGKSSLTSSSTSNIVRLRPPTTSPSTSNDLSNNIASRLTSLFSIPPPPVPNRVRVSTDSAHTSPRDSRRSSATAAQISTPPEALELHPRRSAETPGRSRLRPVQPNGSHSTANHA